MVQAIISIDTYLFLFQCGCADPVTVCEAAKGGFKVGQAFIFHRHLCIVVSLLLL